MADASVAIAQSIQAARLRLHLGILPTSAALSALLCFTITAALWDSQERGLLLAWDGALVLALVLRLGVGWADKRYTRTHGTAGSRWLLWHRLCFMVHGIAWGAAGLVLQDPSRVAQFSLLTIGIIAIAAGSLNSTTFDLKAAMAFVVPALAPMLAVVFLAGDRVSAIRGLIMMTFMAATFIGARRAERIFVEAETLRLAESERANEARRHAEQAEQARIKLADQIHLVTLLMQTTRQGFWFVDNHGITTEVNPAMCELLGRPREDVLRRSVLDFLSGDDQLVMQSELKAREEGRGGNYEVSLLRPDGSASYCMNNATPLYDAAGLRIGSVGIWTDLTARREAEVSLKTYELVANSITDMVSVIGEDLVYRMVNDAWCTALGMARVDVVNRKTADVLSSNISTPQRRAAMSACVIEQRVQSVRSPMDLPGRPNLFIETTYYPYVDRAGGQDIRCVVMVSRDVTQEEHTRQQLAEGAQYLQRTLNATGDAIFAAESTNSHDPVRFVNEQMLDMWGIPRSMLKTLTPDDIMAYAVPLFAEPEEESRRVAELIASNQQYESRVRLRDGRVLLRRCIPAQMGQHILRVWSFRDITALEDALSAVKSSEAGYRGLMDAFPGFITQVDEGLVYTYVNARVAARLGTTPEGMIGRTVRDVVGEDTEAWLVLHVKNLLQGKPVTYERHHLSGDEFGVFDQVTLIKGTDWHTGGWVIYAFGIDITELKRTERSLAATSQQLMKKTQELQLTLDSIDQGIVSFDVNGTIGIHNRHALSLMDLPPDLFDRLTTYDEVVRFQVERGDLAGDASFIDAYGERQYFKGGRRYSPDLYVRKNPSGTMIEVRTRHLDDGGLVRTFADVTGYLEAQQAVRESEAEVRALLGAFPGYIVAMDENLVYTYANNAIATFLGTKPENMVGRPVRDIISEERYRAVTEEVRIARTAKGPVRLNHFAANALHPAVDMEVTHVAGRVKTNGGQVIYVFGIDVTERQQAQQALVAARDAAETANRAKSNFLSHMSHELRTPMNAILGFGQLLELENQSEADRHDWAREVVKGGRHLLSLINEVLDLARVESGKMVVTMEALPVIEVIQDCLTMIGPLADQYGCHLVPPTLSKDLMVWTDRIRLKQVLLNLLSNAVKYNTAGGAVSVTCAPEPLGRDSAQTPMIRIAVTDTGSGLTSEQIGKLFQPFERLEADRDHVEGSGIGLMLSRRLVELISGQLGVESVPGQGSTFWVSLPMSEKK